MDIATGKEFARDITPSYLKGILKKNHPSSKEWQMANAFLMRKNGCDKVAILKKTNQVRVKFQQKPYKPPSFNILLKLGDVPDKKTCALMGTTPIECLKNVMIDDRIKLSYSEVQKVRKHVKGKKLSDTQLAKKILRLTGRKVSKRYAHINRLKFGAKPLFIR